MMYKIMSVNVLGKYLQHESEDEITESRMKTIAECIELYAPASVGVQEYGRQNKKFFPKYLPKKYEFVEFGQDWISTFYDAELLRLEHSICKRLTTSSGQKYCFTIAVFSEKESGKLAYIHGNLHLEYKDKETRIINAEEINAELSELYKDNEDYSTLPLAITGDYNANLVTEPEVFSNMAGELHIRSAMTVADVAEDGQATFHGKLGNPRGEGNAIDHVLVNCDTTHVLSHDVIKENDYPEILDASDHYPVLVEFEPLLRDTTKGKN
ncbi:MAG: hypothetical protein IJZ83_00495 [Clostridia bacterium]|nr:hypothetical protein [Clostridia bacterium]